MGGASIRRAMWLGAGAASVIMTAVAAHGCGLSSLVGTAPPDGGLASSDAATGDAGLDGSADASGDAGCTVCSLTCLQACPVCTSSDGLCVASGGCSRDCGGCANGDHYCDACDADGGGAHRRICSNEGPTGLCATTSYPRCRCTTQGDCGSRQVCANGFCELCGEPGSDNLTCNGDGCKQCTQSTGDCHCG
jgi:hypothetical protein